MHYIIPAEMLSNSVFRYALLMPSSLHLLKMMVCLLMTSCELLDCELPL